MIQTLKRSKRWSLLPAFTIDGYLDWMIVQSSITAALFNDLVQYQVLPHCTPYAGGGPRSVLIMDNAKIHCNEELKRICSEAGVLLEYLPPYSPDLNPIETSFAVLKAWIRRHMDIATLYAESEAFGQFLNLAVQSQRLDGDAGNLFRQAGISYGVDEYIEDDELEELGDEDYA